MRYRCRSILEDVSTLLTPELDAPNAPRSAFTLILIEGPDGGGVWTVDPESPRVLLGKGPVCNIRVADPAVSRRHAALEPAGRRLRVTDLGSANGTFIDGVAIVDAFLRGGEILRVGQTAFRV